MGGNKNAWAADTIVTVLTSNPIIYQSRDVPSVVGSGQDQPTLSLNGHSSHTLVLYF